MHWRWHQRSDEPPSIGEDCHSAAGQDSRLSDGKTAVKLSNEDLGVLEGAGKDSRDSFKAGVKNSHHRCASQRGTQANPGRPNSDLAGV